ncbi:MAG: ABC transporter permease [Acidobacteriota bacterium]
MKKDSNISLIFGLPLYLIIVLGPLLVLLVTSIGAIVAGHADWLALIIPSGRRLKLLVDTLLFALEVALSGMVIGVILASQVQRWHRGFLSYVKWMILAMALVPPFIHASAWTTLFYKLSTSAGLSYVTLQGWSGCWWVQLMSLLPISLGLAMIGLESVDSELVDSARLMRKPMDAFFRISLPLALPTILAGGGILFLVSLIDYTVPSLLQVNVYSLEIFAEFSTNNEPVRAFFLALPLLLISTVVMLASQVPLRNVAAKRKVRTNIDTIADQWPLCYRAIKGLAMALLIVQIIVPIGTLIWNAGSFKTFVDSVLSAKTEIGYSTIIAAFSALLAIWISIIPALEMEQKGWKNSLWWFMIIIPLAIPAPLTGIALVAMWNQSFLPGIYGSTAMPVLAAAARFAPLAAIVILAWKQTIDTNSLDAALVMQKSRRHGIMRVWLPMMRPGILGAGLLVAVLALAELGATLIVAPPGQATITMRVYNLLHYGASESVAGLCLLITLAAGSLGLAVMAITAKNRGRRSRL